MRSTAIATSAVSTAAMPIERKNEKPVNSTTPIAGAT